ncbi:MAG: hypothetical protein GY698_15100 [Actinomycetia bacterium]|nr:hypothetical protein [Actinomycetes bacterium]
MSEPVGAAPVPRIRNHVGALVLLLVVLSLVLDLDDSWTSDDGAYAGQSQALIDGDGWAVPSTLAGGDGVHSPWLNATSSSDGVYPYARHPGWPLLLSPFHRWGGPTGLHVIPLVSVVAAAAVAWYLARIRAPGREPIAFWAVAFSPVLINGFSLWAHAPSAALGGVALLALNRITGGRFARPWPFVLGLALAVGVVLRSEGLLFAAVVTFASVSSVAGNLAARARMAVVVAAPVAVAVVVERAWVARIVGDPLAGDLAPRTGGSWIDGRVRAALELFLEPDLGRSGALLLLGVVGVALIVLIERRWAGPTALAVVVGLAVVYCLRSVTGSAEPAPGLLVAWPLALAALLGLRGASLQTNRVLAGVIGGYVLLVLASQDPVGGGVEWGARFLSPVTVGIAVLAVGALGPTLVRGAGLVVIAAVIVLPTATGLALTERLRGTHESIRLDATAFPADVYVTGQRALPRLAWGSEDARWLLAGPGELGVLLQRLEEAGVRRVAVQGFRESELPRGWVVDGDTGSTRLLVLESDS